MESSSTRPPARTSRTPESFESLSRRNTAAEILQSYEKLSWHSHARGESLVQTRTHFRNIVAGMTEEDEKKNVLWEEDYTPHPPQPVDERQGSRNEKARVSLGESREGSKTPQGDIDRANASDMPTAEQGTKAMASSSGTKRKMGRR